MTRKRLNPLVTMAAGILLSVTTACAVAVLPKARSVDAKDLVGSWRLVRIEYVDARGVTADPYYGTDSTGQLMYDRAGAMSVQIVGHPRPRVAVPQARPMAPEIAKRDALQNAAVLDTYMAYFGTWRFDPPTSTVVHHIDSSLIPEESGMSYSQVVSFEGALLVFTNRSDSAGAVVIRKKFWERMAVPAV